MTQFELEAVIAAGDDGAASTAAAAPTPTSAAVTITAAEAIKWRRRVMSGIVNTFVGRGNWRLALGLLEDLGNEQCGNSKSTSSTVATGDRAVAGVLTGSGQEAGATGALRVELLSRIGRIFLQFGSLEDAEVYFHRAEEAVAATGCAKEDNPRVSLSVGWSLSLSFLPVSPVFCLNDMAWDRCDVLYP